jgi:hypothetical protein
MQRVRLLSGEKGITIGKNENFEFPLWEIKLENGKILTEARYRFDVLTEPEVSNDLLKNEMSNEIFAWTDLQL